MLYKGEGLPTIQSEFVKVRPDNLPTDRGEFQVVPAFRLVGIGRRHFSARRIGNLATQIQEKEQQETRKYEERALPQGEQRVQYLHAINRAFYRYGLNQLDLDFSQTLVPPEYYHYFEEAVYDELFRPDSSGVTLEHRQMVIKEHSLLSNTMKITNHETAHSVATRLLYSRKSQRVISTRSGSLGYRTPQGGFAFFNELVVSMTEADVRIHEWKDDPLLDSVRDGIPGYLGLIVLGEELLQRVAHDEQTDFRTVLRGVQRGHYLRNTRGLQPIVRSIGFPGMKRLHDWDIWSTGAEHVATLKALAADLGLKESLEKMQDIENGHEITLLDTLASGVRIRRTRNEVPIFEGVEATVPTAPAEATVETQEDITQEDSTIYNGLAFDNVDSVSEVEDVETEQPAPEEITRPEPRRQIEEIE